MFDTETMAWVEINVSPSIFKPLARYAHLSTLWDNDKLVIIGGQDITNHHINEMSVFDLQQKAWIHGSSINGLYDAYRAVAFCPLAYDGSGKSNAPFWQEDPVEESSSIEELPPPPACIYSNYNFNDIARDLQSFCPLKSYPSTVDFNNHTSNIAGTILPPGLRFPTGQLMGHYFIISGTFLSTTQRGFQVWVLNLSNLTWSHIDTGSALGNGSWNRGLVVNKKFYILGNGYRDLKEDYSYRRLNFEHVAVIDLEAFGIYTMPTESCSPAAQELGLTILNEHGLSDVIIVTTDQQSISANSNILSERWPEFSQLMAQTKKDQLQKRHLLFPEAYPVTLAFLQFIYTDHLITAQQHQPQILSRLLILADMYKMDRLKQLATYGLHQLLTISTASMVYETATLTFQSALQIRALRIMMNAKRMLLQQQPPSDWMPLSPSNSTYSDEPIVRKQLSSSTSENSQRFKSPPSTPKKMYIPNDKIGGQPFPFTFH
jgi:hypothetical protein